MNLLVEIMLYKNLFSQAGSSSFAYVGYRYKRGVD